MQNIPVEFSDIVTTKLTLSANMPTIAASKDVKSLLRTSRNCLLINNTSDKTIYIGGSDVDSSSVQLLAGGSIVLMPRKPESVWLYSDTPVNVVIAEFFE